MLKNIEISYRTFKNLSEYCKANKIKFSEYVEEAVSSKLYSDMYGDLNLLTKNCFLIKITKSELDINNKLLYLWAESPFDENNPIKVPLDVHNNFKECIEKWSKEILPKDTSNTVESETKEESEGESVNTKKRKLKIKS